MRCGVKLFCLKEATIFATVQNFSDCIKSDAISAADYAVARQSVAPFAAMRRAAGQYSIN
jgi:hypothetical protein